MENAGVVIPEGVRSSERFTFVELDQVLDSKTIPLRGPVAGHSIDFALVRLDGVSQIRQLPILPVVAI
jgi:hypothetical protein